MQLKLTFLLTLLALFFSASSYAGEWRIGVIAGQSKIDDLEDSCAFTCTIDEDSDTATGINVAYRSDHVWGIELGYLDLGSYGTTQFAFTRLLPLVIDADVDFSASYLAATATVQLSDNLSLTGRLGAASVDFDINVRAAGIGASGSESSTEGIGGLSLDYAFNQRFSAGLRYDRIDRINLLSLGLNVGF